MILIFIYLNIKKAKKKKVEKQTTLTYHERICKF